MTATEPGPIIARDKYGRPEPTDPAELAVKYDPLCHKIANRYRDRLPSPGDYDDLLQCVRVKVWRCAVAFRPERGFAFTTLANLSLGRAARLFCREARRRGFTRVGDSPTCVARHGAPRRPIVTTHTQRADRPPDDRRDVLETLVADRRPGPHRVRLPLEVWGEALTGLTDREKVVVILRRRLGLCFADVAGSTGIKSRQRVQQIEQAALAKLAGCDKVLLLEGDS